MRRGSRAGIEEAWGQAEQRSCRLGGWVNCGRGRGRRGQDYVGAVAASGHCTHMVPHNAAARLLPGPHPALLHFVPELPHLPHLSHLSHLPHPHSILPLDAICGRAQTDVNSLLKEDPAVMKYVDDVRSGRVKSPPPLPPAPAAPAAAAAAAAAAARSVSPQPDVAKTLGSLFTNVRAGVGAVAPGAPLMPQAPVRSPSPTRSVSPSFPRASAGTGMPPPVGMNGATPRVAAAPPTPPPVSRPAAPAAAPAAGSGFTMPNFSASLSGLTGGAAAAAKSAADAASSKLTKMADSMSSGAAAPAPPAAPARPSTSPRPSASSPISSSADADRSDSSRRPVNWRDELQSLKATREPNGNGNGSGVAPAAGRADADEEALRRFGNLAGRSRSGNGGGGSSDTELSEANRPRTRPDWRNQL